MEIKEPYVSLITITPDPEKVIEEAGRTCYLSFERMTGETGKKFIPGAIKRGHLSILEHASATFRIKGASRAFTHQLVRHRVASFSQQSQRYVSEDEFNYIIPPAILENSEACNIYRDFMDHVRQTYKKLRDLDVLKEDARFVLPNALESEIVFTANFRELRHLFELRLAPDAQWEIRRVCFNMLQIVQKHAPAVFLDFETNKNKYTASSKYSR
jgi:thymidylate synthase (FAD)